MKERKETINIYMANIMALVLLIPSAIFGIAIYTLRWGADRLISDLTDSFQPPSPFLFALILIIGIVVHELIHGLFWSMGAKNGFKSISFGVMWKMLTPYCHCSEPLKVPDYRRGALAPLVILGILPLLALALIPSAGLLWFGVIMTSSAAGDIMVAWKLRKEDPSNTVLDHDSEAGYLVFEPED